MYIGWFYNVLSQFVIFRNNNKNNNNNNNNNNKNNDKRLNAWLELARCYHQNGTLAENSRFRHR